MKKIFKEIRKRFHSSEFQELETLLIEIKKMRELGFSDFQNIPELIKTWNIDQCKNIDGNACILRSKSNEFCEIETWIPPGGGFSKHWHSNTETCEVLSGVLADKIVTPNDEYKKGQILQYKPYERHMPYNPSNDHITHLLVTFYL